jgi:hypothetical protein
VYENDARRHFRTPSRKKWKKKFFYLFVWENFSSFSVFLCSGSQPVHSAMPHEVF